MNLKKNILLIVTLNIIFTTEAFARFSVKPLRPDDARGWPPRNTHRSPVLSPQENQQENITKNSQVPTWNKNRTANKRSAPLAARKEPLKRRQGTFSKRLNSVLDPVTKTMRVLNEIVNKRPVVPARRSPRVANNRPALRSPTPPQNIQWEAAYITSNGVVVKRTRRGVEVYNTGFPSLAASRHYKKGTMINGTRLKSDVDLNLQQSPTEFQNQVAKFGKINRIVPMN